MPKRRQILVLIGLSAFFWGCDARNPVTTLDLELLSGRELSGLSDYQKLIADHADETILVNFWSAGCNACRYEAPVLNRIYLEYESKIAVLAINVDPITTIKQAREYASSLGLQFDVYLDKDRKIFDSLRLQFFPTNLFYGPDKGKAPIVVIGALEYSNAKAVLDQLLNE